MKTKFLFKLLAATSMLVITLAFSNITVFADDAPPSIPDPFGGTDEDAPPSLELNKPPADTTKTPDTVSPGGGSPSGGSGGSPILLKKKTKTTDTKKSADKVVTDLDKDGDIDTADEIIFQQQQEQGITETGPGLGYLLFVGGALALRNLKKLKKT